MDGKYRIRYEIYDWSLNAASDPDDIASVIAPWTCLVDAVDQQAYTDKFTRAGFKILKFSDESAGLTSLINLLKRKLLLLGHSRESEDDVLK